MPTWVLMVLISFLLFVFFMVYTAMFKLVFFIIAIGAAALAIAFMVKIVLPVVKWCQKPFKC